MAEINRTVDENIIPIGSKMKLKIMGVEEIDTIDHSKSSVFDDQIIITVNGNVIIRSNHIMLLAIEDKLIDGLFIFRKLIGSKLMYFFEIEGENSCNMNLK